MYITYIIYHPSIFIQNGHFSLERWNVCPSICSFICSYIHLLHCSFIHYIFYSGSGILAAFESLSGSHWPASALIRQTFVHLPSDRPPARLYIGSSVRPSVCLCPFPFIRLSVRPHTLVYVRPSVRPSVRMSVHPSILLSGHIVCSPVRPFINPSVHPSIHPADH